MHTMLSFFLSRKKAIFVFVLLLCIGYLGYIIYRGYSKSLFATHQSRITTVFFTQSGVELISYGDDGIHYKVKVPAEVKLRVPGGYGIYKAGAIHRLAELEKKPYILHEVGTYFASSFIDGYVVPSTESLPGGGISLASLILKSQSSFSTLDKLFIAWLAFNTEDESIKEIDIFTKEESQDLLLDYKDLQKSLQGILYHREFRDEGKTVKILYLQSGQAGEALAAILEGSGIRVGDIGYTTQIDHANEERCVVYESAQTHSLAALKIASYFECDLRSESKSEASGYDILLVMPKGFEAKWDL